jgi:beta-glucanase (GH16 family)
MQVDFRSAFKFAAMVSVMLLSACASNSGGNGGNNTAECVPPAGTYKLVWSDEFKDAATLKPNSPNWTYDVGDGSESGIPGWGNRELQYYTNGANASIVTDADADDKSALQIQVRLENNSCYLGTCKYSSSRIKTKGKHEFKYGLIEARMKRTKAMGHWPAFWMLGANIDDVKWPNCGEIDIFEQRNIEDTNLGTAHYSNDFGGHTMSLVGLAPVDPTVYNTYAVEWTPCSIKWKLNGMQYNDHDIANGIGGTEEFHQPFFILFNYALGGNFAGNEVPPDSTFPANLLVDYVRVHQLQ